MTPLSVILSQRFLSATSNMIIARFFFTPTLAANDQQPPAEQNAKEPDAA